MMATPIPVFVPVLIGTAILWAMAACSGLIRASLRVEAGSRVASGARHMARRRLEP